MSFMDILIEATTLASALYLSVAFVAGLGHPRPAAGAVAQVEADPAPATERGWIVTDCVVPFQRRRPVPTDCELIALAKSTNYPGAAKWSYSRKLRVIVKSGV